jgi:hypothetical protein
MTHWLKRHFFSYKKPALVPGKANEEQQKLWITEYEKLKQGLADDETICFMDGVHPTHNTQLAYGWIKKGKERVMYNTYYEYFEDFKSAIIGFLESVSSLDPACVLGQAFASRVRDKFRPIGAPFSTS